VTTLILQNSFWQNTWNQIGRGLFGFGLGLGLWRVRNRFKLRARASLHLIFGVILSGLVLVLNYFSKELALFVSSPLFATSIWMFYRFETQVTKIWLSSSLKYLGRLSYGIYVWHVVSTNILSVLSKNLKIEFLEIGYCLGIPRLFAVLLLAMIFTELTIRFIESPIRIRFKRV
jgi:peptidoglycan/LPS O-acetylase OafA/YrhL